MSESGADRLAASLAELGVTHAFGLPGTQNAAAFSALPDHGVTSVLATHEASAAFMANGYARASGRPGVVLTIPGPGFAFALPGVAEARLDSAPLLLLTGAPPDDDGRRFLHQAIDQAAIAAPLVKEVVEIRRPGDIARALAHAHDVALAGEPGPVLVHLAPGLLHAEVDEPEGDEGPERGPAGRPDERWREALAPLAHAAERPVLFVGGGARGCAGGVRELAEAWPAPVFTTLSGRGILPEDHPHALGFDADRGGLDALNDLVERSDLVLALGCKLGHNGTAGFGLSLPADRLVHVNTDARALEANYPARLAIEADACAVVEHLLATLAAEGTEAPASTWRPDEIAELAGRIGEPAPPRTPEPAFPGQPGSGPRGFFEALQEALPRDAIVVTDSGLHQVMTRRYLRVLSPGGLLVPSDLQSMGFGVPAAIGARLAAPERPVVAIVGDGGFLMTAMDLLCARRAGVTLPVVVFNDGWLNLIRLQQLRDRGRGEAVRLDTPDLAALASSLGVAYEGPGASVDAALRRGLERRGPTLIEVPLGDSPAIQARRVEGGVKHLARRTLPDGWIGTLKRLLGRSRR